MIREALRLLEEQDRLRQMKFEDLKRDIAVGIEQADRGELIEGKAILQKIRSRSKES